jgi:hypothetical protein
MTPTEKLVDDILFRSPPEVETLRVWIEGLSMSPKEIADKLHHLSLPDQSGRREPNADLFAKAAEALRRPLPERQQ